MMPRMIVTAIARTNRVRSSLRIFQIAYWQVNELVISRIVAISTNEYEVTPSVVTTGSTCRWNGSDVSGLIGGHWAALARMLKYAANSPPKNITSEVMNRSI